MPKSFEKPEVREDIVFLKLMRMEFGVFTDLAPDAIRDAVQKGSVIVPCADGDQLHDLLTHHRNVCGCPDKCHHSPALNGGPLLLSDQVPAEMRSDGDVLLRHTFEGKAIKGIDTVVLYGHAPCGKARGNNISAPEALDHYVRAKHRVRTYAHEAGITLDACHLWMHIQWPDGARRSYFFNRKAWESPECVKFTQDWLSAPQYRSEQTHRLWEQFWGSALAA